MLRTAFIVALVPLLVAVSGLAKAEDAPPAESVAEARNSNFKDPSDLLPKELNPLIKALDRSDGAVSFARSMQRDGTIFLVAGGVLSGASLGFAAAEGLGGAGEAGPYVASIGVPVGIGLIIAGIPHVVLSQRLLGEYALNGPVEGDFARLRLLQRWRLRQFRWMSDGSLFGAAFLGVAGIFSAVTWAVRDADGVNGVVGDPANYRPLDGLTSMAFLGTAGGLVATGLVYFFELKNELETPHRLFAAPVLDVSPLPPVAGAPGGVRVSAGLVLRF